MANKNRVLPTPPQPDPEAEKWKNWREQPPIWFACRATPGCPGQQARIRFKRRLAEGQIQTRYICTTCEKPFHLTTYG